MYTECRLLFLRFPKFGSLLIVLRFFEVVILVSRHHVGDLMTEKCYVVGHNVPTSCPAANVGHFVPSNHAVTTF